MEYTVSRDETVRTVLVVITGAEPMATSPHCRRAASFQPTRVTFWVRSDRTLVDVSGPIVLRSGKTSASKMESRSWVRRDLSRDGDLFRREAPRWLADMADELLGSTGTTEPERTEEEIRAEIYAEEYGHPYTDQGREILRAALKGGPRG